MGDTYFFYTTSSYVPRKTILIDSTLLIPKKIYSQILNIVKIVTLINNIPFKILNKKEILDEKINENYLIIGNKTLYDSLCLNFISFDFLSVIPINDQIENFFDKNILNKFTNILFRKLSLTTGIFYRIKERLYAISKSKINILNSTINSRKAIYAKPDQKIIVSLLSYNVYKIVQEVGYSNFPEILIKYLFIVTSIKLHNCAYKYGPRCSITGFSKECLIKNDNNLVLPIKILDNKLVEINDGFINERLFKDSLFLGYNEKLYKWKSNEKLVIYILSNKLTEFRIYLLNEIYMSKKNKLLEKLFGHGREEEIIKLSISYFNKMKLKEKNHLILSSFNVSKYLIDSLKFVKNHFDYFESIIMFTEKITEVKKSLVNKDFRYNKIYEQNVLKNLLEMSNINRLVKNLRKLDNKYFLDMEYIYYLLSFKLNIKSHREHLMNYLFNIPADKIYIKKKSIKVIENEKLKSIIYL